MFNKNHMAEIMELLPVLNSFIDGYFEADNIYVHYNDTSKITFPTLYKDCEKLMKNSHQANFGKNDQSVFDPEYRNANVLYPNEYLTNFDPYESGIIDHIQNQLSDCHVKLIRDKLNIYPTGGHFKIHKDTPKSPDMIGTLVVCLQSAFAGGDFILYPHDKQTRLNFSDQSSTHIQWVAFYGDIDHEIETVTSGYRITLTYHIIKLGDKPKLTTNSYITDAVLDLLKNENFLPDGGIIGYGCQYMYSNVTSETNSFKGEDSIMFNCFDKLGIRPKVCNVATYLETLDNHVCEMCLMNGNECDLIYRNDEEDLDLCLKCSITEEGKKFMEKNQLEMMFYAAPANYKHIDADDRKDMIDRHCKIIKNVYWINKPNRCDGELVLQANILYGNDPTTNEEIYKHCVFLINIKPFHLRNFKS